MERAQGMQIYYLYHSAVCVVQKNVLLIFDYFLHKKGKKISDGFIHEDMIREADRIYVFVSHSHHDHYHPRIFKWARMNDHITYILDSTLPKVRTKAKTVIMSRGDTYEDDYISVQEFGSTDIGGSFYAVFDGTSFFHAGDLNNWHWKDDGNEKYSRVMKMYFERELKFIKSRVDHIDYAFFPVDKRMGSDYDEGADMFIDAMKPEHFIPIHFVDFDDTAAFAKKTCRQRYAGFGCKEIRAKAGIKKFLPNLKRI